jgi:GNAT superfamily N-acetyltransferase
VPSSPLFVTASHARRIEHAERSLVVEGATAARRRIDHDQMVIAPIAGGAAVFTEPGSPFNKLAGLGFDGVPDEHALAVIEREFERRDCPLQVELASLADPAIGRLLTRRGYELVGFENVLGRPLASESTESLPDAPPDRSVVVTRAGPDDGESWMHAVTTGFLHPDAFDGPASHESFERDVLERIYTDLAAVSSYERYIARREGAVAGGASLRLDEGIAQLCGAATLPDHRRHGVQTALLRYRLLEASRRGCDIAIVTTQPGSKSQQNVQRFGFTLLYARAILVRARGNSQLPTPKLQLPTSNFQLPR